MYFLLLLYFLLTNIYANCLKDERLHDVYGNKLSIYNNIYYSVLNVERNCIYWAPVSGNSTCSQYQLNYNNIRHFGYVNYRWLIYQLSNGYYKIYDYGQYGMF